MELTHHQPEHEGTQKDDRTSSPSDQQVEQDTSITEPRPVVLDRKGIELMLNTEFWMVIIVTMFSISVDKVFFYNVGTYLRSFKMEDRSYIFFIAGPVCATLGKLIIGSLVHVFQRETQRMTFVCLALFHKSILLILFALFGDNFGILFLSTMTNYGSTALEFVVIPIIFMEYFGGKYFPRNWGSTVFGVGIATFILQAIVGHSYDSHIFSKDSYTCYGLKCFYLANILFVILTISAFLASVFVWYQRHKKHMG